MEENFDPTVRKFLFKCCGCEMIVSVPFAEQYEVDKVIAGEVELDCPCGSISYALLD